MKITSITLLAGVCACFSLQANAQPRVLTLDNKPGAVAMFTTLQAAYNAARDGDTIMVAGSPSTYANGFACYKRINFIGPGHRLAENGIPGVIKDAATIINLSINSDSVLGDSSGSTFSGLVLQQPLVSGNGNKVPTVLLFDRCNVSALYTYNNKSTQFIFTRCGLSFGQTSANEFTGGGSVIRNSIISGIKINSDDVTLSNCIIRGRCDTQKTTASISNSIIISGTATHSSFASAFKGSVTHSIAVGDSTVPEERRSFLPSGGGNLNGFNRADVFIPSGTGDGQWELKDESPAIGTGYAGTDMGIFGGGNPYVLSGVPPLPRITRLVVPASATEATGLRFEVDAKAH